MPFLISNQVIQSMNAINQLKKKLRVITFEWIGRFANFKNSPKAYK